MDRVYRTFAIAGGLTFAVAALLTWQGEREWPLMLGAIAIGLVLPALHRSHRRWAGWPKDMRDRIARSGGGG